MSTTKTFLFWKRPYMSSAQFPSRSMQASCAPPCHRTVHPSVPHPVPHYILWLFSYRYILSQGVELSPLREVRHSVLNLLITTFNYVFTLFLSLSLLKQKLNTCDMMIKIHKRHYTETQTIRKIIFLMKMLKLYLSISFCSHALTQKLRVETAEQERYDLRFGVKRDR